jgi:pimeloyl-ACP methyl ester carboxylesterase
MSWVGFSGGAQLGHRYAMAHPQRVSSLVAIAAGWYTLPDSNAHFPYGLRTERALRGYNLNPEQFLRVPTTVIVGASDTGSTNLRRSPKLDAAQGSTRVERARHWVAHMRLAAARHGLSPAVRYFEVPGIGHDFEEFVELGHLLQLVHDGLLQDSTPLSASRQRSDAGRGGDRPAQPGAMQRDCG